MSAAGDKIERLQCENERLTSLLQKANLEIEKASPEWYTAKVKELDAQYKGHVRNLQLAIAEKSTRIKKLEGLIQDLWRESQT